MIKRINNFLLKAENFILPESCLACRQTGQALCPACRALIKKIPERCPACGRGQKLGFFCSACAHLSNEVFFDGLIAYGDYQDRILARAIKAMKYQGVQKLGKTLGRMLGRRLIEHWRLSSAKAPDNTPILMPIPLHPRRYRRRGFNQSLLIAAGISEKTGWPINEGLKRKSWQKPSAGLTYEQRRRQEKIFHYQGPSLQKQQIILVDDVVTTGATIQAASRTLKSAGAELVLAAVLAQSL